MFLHFECLPVLSRCNAHGHACITESEAERSLTKHPALFNHSLNLGAQHVAFPTLRAYLDLEDRAPDSWTAPSPNFRFDTRAASLGK